MAPVNRISDIFDDYTPPEVLTEVDLERLATDVLYQLGVKQRIRVAKSVPHVYIHSHTPDVSVNIDSVIEQSISDADEQFPHTIITRKPTSYSSYDLFRFTGAITAVFTIGMAGLDFVASTIAAYEPSAYEVPMNTTSFRDALVRWF